MCQLSEPLTFQRPQHGFQKELHPSWLLYLHKHMNNNYNSNEAIKLYSVNYGKVRLKYSALRMTLEQLQREREPLPWFQAVIVQQRKIEDRNWISSVQSISHVQLFATPWTVACQASLSITNSWSLLRLLSIESVMPSNHLILCHPLLLLPLLFPNIRVFSGESVLCIR